MSLASVSTDLAVIGNCQVSALIDAAGQMLWACMPRPDSEPIFCALLDGAATAPARGVFGIECVNGVHTSQAYLRNTAVLETLLTDAAGNVVRMIDFCPRFRQNARIFRPPTFVRILEPVQGHAQLRLHFHPNTGYGAQEPKLRLGSHHLAFHLAEMHCRLTTNASLTAVMESRPFSPEGALAFILGPDYVIEEAPLVAARSWLAQTEIYWQDWVRSLAIPLDWQEAVIRSAITLKLCTFEDTGAVLAALTTSIPEHPDSGRNWDYRYCWLRDSFFVIQALNRLGATRTMEGYLRYIINIVAQSPAGLLQPLYGINGEQDTAESIVQTLPGYRGMGPVRVGNAAALQRQNDVYGAVVLAASQCFYDARLMSPGSVQLFQQLEALGMHAASLFEHPDAGPWEFRGREQRHTFSAVMCWAACDRLARIAVQLGQTHRIGHWRELATQMRERILQQAWNADVNSLMGSFGGNEIDATLLLLPELGFLPATDPRFLSTLAAIDRQLRSGDLLLRYRHPDDFGPPVNAFTVCSFWYVNALAGAGRQDEAVQIFERLLQRRNRLGLLSEDIDPVSGEHWGNYPQTYSMVGIISCALRLSRQWEEVV